MPAMEAVVAEEDLSQVVKDQKLSPVQAPFLTANAVRLMGGGPDVILTLDRIVPMTGQNATTDIAMLQPVAMLSLSVGVAKDLSLLLADHIKKHEAQFGVIATPYTQQRVAK